MYMEMPITGSKTEFTEIRLLGGSFRITKYEPWSVPCRDGLAV
jgi:hypothetical protein